MSGDELMKVHVECYSGYRGEQTPRSVDFGARKIEIVEVVDSWLAPDHRYFKVRADDGASYILRHDPFGQYWTVSVFESGPPPK